MRRSRNVPSSAWKVVMRSKRVRGRRGKKGCGQERDDGSEVLFLSCPAGGNGRRQANHETWCRNADLFQNDSTVSHGGAPGPCQHRVQKPKRAGGRGKGRRDEVTTELQVAILSAGSTAVLPGTETPHPVPPRPPSRGTAVDHAWPPPTRERGGEHPSDDPARHAWQSSTSKKKKGEKRCTYWLTAASRL